MQRPNMARRAVAVAVATLALLLAACTSAGSPTPKLTGPAWTATPIVPGFTPGTKDAPRIVQISADTQINFTPGLVQAVNGETVTFRIHNTGAAYHKFMIGSVADVFANKKGTPEVPDIGQDQTAELTFTFEGTGPFAFACHVPGHFEHGMIGYVQLVGPGAPALGTKDNPRVVSLTMDDKLKFTPDSVTVAKGETIRFVLTNNGTVVHQFEVGPADKVAANAVDGTIVVEKQDLAGGSTHAVDYTFDGSGPYAFASHEAGQYEAGMKGVIVLN